MPNRLSLPGELAGSIADVVVGSLAMELELPNFEFAAGVAEPRVVPPRVESVRDDVHWS